MSVGTVVLFCPNTPPELRYKPENVFIVGIIPGSKEPSVLQMNNLLRPLVTELQELWVGKQLYSSGDLSLNVRAALVVLTCDLPAARKVAGFESHASNLFCSCYYLQRQNIESLDVASWEMRTRERYNAETIAWRAAVPIKDKEARFAQTASGGRCLASCRVGNQSGCYRLTSCTIFRVSFNTT